MPNQNEALTQAFEMIDKLYRQIELAREVLSEQLSHTGYDIDRARVQDVMEILRDGRTERKH